MCRQRGFVELLTHSDPMLTGNLLALGLGALIAVVGSLVFPDRDFNFQTIYLVGHASFAQAIIETPESPSVERTESGEKGSDKDRDLTATAVLPASDEAKIAPPEEDPELDQVKLRKAYRLACWCSLILFGLLVVLIPAMAVIPRVWSEVRSREVA